MLPPFDTVIVPVDFSEPSLAAVEVARQWVADASHLYLVHVLPELSASETGLVWDTISAASRIEHAEGSLRKQFADEKYRGVHALAVVGEPGHKIAEVAAKLEADLIVIPSHGRTGLKRLLIGSVAERVVRHAHCPVLVLRD